MHGTKRQVLVAAMTVAIAGGAAMRITGDPQLRTRQDVERHLDGMAESAVPGIQYAVVSADELVFRHAAGWADIASERPMSHDTTMMAFSMTKTVTAAASLQLVERGVLSLDDELDAFVPDTPYAGRGITVRQLISHTSGIPNPIPLRWVHLADDEESFDEAAALASVLEANPKLDSEPGEQYAYSNIGYWLLGKVIEVASGQRYADFVAQHVLEPLGVAAEMSVGIDEPERHASGYLARWSVTNLIKGFVTDSAFWGDYSGDWLRIRNHHLDGPAFGGLVGTATGFGRFLQDQLRPTSVLFGDETRTIFHSPQQSASGQPLPMTLGWHIGDADGTPYLFKEGGGGGFHAEMRLYPESGLGTVVMVSNTDFDSTSFLNRVDRVFIGEKEGRP